MARPHEIRKGLFQSTSACMRINCRQFKHRNTGNYNNIVGSAQLFPAQSLTLGLANSVHGQLVSRAPLQAPTSSLSLRQVPGSSVGEQRGAHTAVPKLGPRTSKDLTVSKNQGRKPRGSWQPLGVTGSLSPLVPQGSVPPEPAMSTLRGGSTQEPPVIPLLRGHRRSCPSGSGRACGLRRGWTSNAAQAPTAASLVESVFGLLRSSC